MITKQKYVEYLVSTPINYPVPTWEHLEGRARCGQRLPEKRAAHSQASMGTGRRTDRRQSGRYLIIDAVYKAIHGNRNGAAQYSGARRSGARQWSIWFTPRHYPLDFRIYAKAADGKTKNDHFQEMLLRAVSDTRFRPSVLFDSWYGSWQNLKLVDRGPSTLHSKPTAWSV